MPSRLIHLRIDKEVLKPLKLIPKNFQTGDIHAAMDEGTINHGSWFHRVIDKWHEPRFQANVGFNTSKEPIPKDMIKEANWIYRVAKVHRIADEYYLQYRAKYQKNPKFENVKKFLLKKLSDKNLIRRHFNI